MKVGDLKIIWSGNWPISDHNHGPEDTPMMVTSFLLPLLLTSLLFSYANVGGVGCVSASASRNSPSAGSTAADGYAQTPREGGKNIISCDN
jgi:hypothetical protein